MRLVQQSYELLEQEIPVRKMDDYDGSHFREQYIDNMYKHIERCGKTCYRSEHTIKEGSAKKFVDRLIKSSHVSVLEHGVVYLKAQTGKPSDIGMTLYNWPFKGDYKEYSKINRQIIEKEPNKSQADFVSKVTEEYTYITTTYRVIIDNHWEDDLQYLCEPTEYHEKRHTVLLHSCIHVYKDLTRHRKASFSIESTRFCVSGNTIPTFKNPHTRYTIKELYQDRQSSNRLSNVLIEVLDTNSGILEYSKIKNIYNNGIKPVYKLTTRLGYTLICTEYHKIYTDSGWKELKDLKIGDSIYVNGTEVTTPLYQDYDWLYNQYITLNKSCSIISKEFGYKTDVLRKWLNKFKIVRDKPKEEPLYKNKDWMYEQNITLNKTFVQIAKETGFNVSTLKNWGKKLGLPAKGTGYFNKGKTPWNKGLKEGDAPRLDKQIQALREYHHDKNDSRTILKIDTSEYQKYVKDNCEICGASERLQVHHIDHNRSNNYPDNLLTVCPECHQRIHNQSLKTIYSDNITTIEYIGEEEVFDLEIDNYHNYIANGIVVHNCNYSQDKFGGELKFVLPPWIKDVEDEYDTCLGHFENQLELVEECYNYMTKNGWQPQQAAEILPQCTSADVVMTAYESDWSFIFDLRVLDKTGKAHPLVHEVLDPVYDEFKEKGWVK